MNLRLLIFAVLLFSTQSLAGTWEVEKDGTGDFAVIQDAVNAAASGDTIMVGSGRYNEWVIYGYSNSATARILVENKDLVIAGEADKSTIVGPNVPYDPYNNIDYLHCGIAIISDSKVVVENIIFENLHHGLVSWVAGNAIISNCNFVGNEKAILLVEGSGEVLDCNFSARSLTKYFVWSYFQENFVVKRCSFECDFNRDRRLVTISGNIQARVTNCRLIGGLTGIQLDRGASCFVKDCTFFDNRLCFNLAEGGREFEILDCTMTNQDIVFRCNNFFEPYTVKMERNVIADVGFATFVSNHLRYGYVRDCVLAKGDRGVVLFGNHWTSNKDLSEQSLPTYEFDMRNNYWGTDNPDSIQAWIDDSFDDPECDYTILWEPFKKYPYTIPVEIDIKPGSDTNPINCKLPIKSTVPVAILGSDEFDVTTLDQTTVRFGPDEAVAFNNSEQGQARYSLDINRDGHLDRMFHFFLAETGIRCGDTGATLTGETFDGEPVLGTDVIRTVPKGEIDPASDKIVAISPNPFNPMALVSFKVEQSQRVSVSVYDVRGRCVANISEQHYEPGEHTVVWKGQDSSGLEVPSGAYFFRVEMGDWVETQKALLLR